MQAGLGCRTAHLDESTTHEEEHVGMDGRLSRKAATCFHYGCDLEQSGGAMSSTRRTPPGSEHCGGAACIASGAVLPKALWQFGNMIQCAQPGVNPLAYNNYGCWCGFSGKGTPRDEVDMCCNVHDKCYATSRRVPGCTAIADLPYVLVYDFTCSNQQVACSATNNKCQAAVCECDRVAAHCFAQAKYNPENKNLDSKVHCVN